ncbi:conserved hypothetical protein [Ricinus communis]|uniref:Uncharacterized protein n=1 Tax=Ricinus communis TaxID=3988 RepID=B9SX50_RICCO|nr:conserved hypothetical protein [Ricinus communis]
MDALIVFPGLKDSSFNSGVGLIMEDLKQIARSFPGLQFKFVRWFANGAVHFLARLPVLCQITGILFLVMDVLASDIAK